MLRYAADVSTQSLKEKHFICQDSLMSKKWILLCCVISVSSFNRTMADILRNVKDSHRGCLLLSFFCRNVQVLLCRLFTRFLIQALFWKKKNTVLIWYIWTGCHSLLLIFIWAKLWGNVRIYPKSLSISLYLSFFIYIQYIYHILLLSINLEFV